MIGLLNFFSQSIHGNFDASRPYIRPLQTALQQICWVSASRLNSSKTEFLIIYLFVSKPNYLKQATFTQYHPLILRAIGLIFDEHLT